MACFIYPFDKLYNFIKVDDEGQDGYCKNLFENRFGAK